MKTLVSIGLGGIAGAIAAGGVIMAFPSAPWTLLLPLLVLTSAAAGLIVGVGLSLISQALDGGV